MLKKLVIFDVPEDFYHPLLNKSIRGSDFIIVMVPQTHLKKLEATLDFDMICVDDMKKKEEDSSIRLRKCEPHDFGFEEKLKKVSLAEKEQGNDQTREDSNKTSDKESENLKLPDDDRIENLHEKFILFSDTSAQVLLNSFTSPQMLRLFSGPITTSNKYKYIIYQNHIYAHYLDEIFLWGQVEQGKFYFSNDDKYLVVRQQNATILYTLDTMKTQVLPPCDRVVFGKNIVVLDRMLFELEENTKDIYEYIILENDSSNKKSVVDDWVDSNEEEQEEQDVILLKEFTDIFFSPTEYNFIAIVDDKLTIFNYVKEKNKIEPVITRSNISSDMIKDIQFCHNRSFAVITKYINNRLKYFIESYSDFVTVTELAENMDLTFRFNEKSFLIGSGSTVKYYELKNKLFVLMNTVENVNSSLIDIYKDFYCTLNFNDELLIYKGKDLIKVQNQTFNNINSIKISPSGLFFAVYSQVQVSLYDCNGNFIWNKICGDLRGFTFFENSRIPDEKKNLIKSAFNKNKTLTLNTILGKKKDQNVSCFLKKVKTLEEKRMSWISFLCSINSVN